MKIELVKQLIQEFENSKVHKMKIEIEDLKLELEKPKVFTQEVAAPMPREIPVPETTVTPVVEDTLPPIQGTPIKSPIVGVFYSSSSPTAKPYVEVGTTVKAGQVLCIVEAMKVMNEIKAPIDGVITAVLVNDDDLVEFDQTLMLIEG